MNGIRSGIIFFLFTVFTITHGQIPPGYYNPASGLTGTALQQALHDIIDNHTSVSYNSLYTYFEQTDVKPGSVVWDMYSDIPGVAPVPPYPYHYNAGDECGTYNSEGDCYNREHSWPDSWFNGASPMHSDLFHLYPTDGYVNNRRGSYPYGKVGTASWTSINGCKVGPCVSPGYSGTVFEPRDEYKGDFARTYFYMSTRYYTEDASWDINDMINKSQLKPWAQALMMLWSLTDPVSQKEIDRNNVIYANVQLNRNPYIDHPEYTTQVWAKTYTWNATSGSWSTPANWTPARTNAYPGDILIFDGAVKPVSTVTVDFTGTEWVSRIRIINNANVTITGTATTARTVNIGVPGAVSPQFEITAGSTLAVNAAGALTLSLGAGYTATIGGNMVFQNAAHQLTGTNAGSVVFSSGSVFTAGTAFSGTPFGTTALNSVIFASGSVYSLESGLPPFGAAIPNSVVVFQPGSMYKHLANSAPSLPGRTYSNFEINSSTFNQAVTAGTSGCIMDNLTVTNAVLAGFDFPGGCIIRGNLTVTAGTLRFAPASTGILKFDAAGTQTISGPGILETGPYCDLTIGTASSTLLNKSLSLGRDIQILPGGTFTVNPGATLTVNGQAVIN